MKKAGDLLSAILDENMLGKAREYSKLFSAWEHLTQKHGIAAAASHSRLSDIKRDILLVETDHPGWIQILQAKKHLLLSDMQSAFPGLGINGIAFKLGKSPADPVQAAPVPVEPAAPEQTSAAGEQPAKANSPAGSAGKKLPGKKQPGYKKINNKELAEKLKSLEKSINDLPLR